MANIRVDVGYTIKNGTEIKFRSPVDCSAITGLIVYYPGTDGKTTSKVFTLADAHGSNVGIIDHLFAEDVVVKVILDVTASMAFVQNADTNAYLEAALASKAQKDHGHELSGLAGTLPIEKGGTGATTAADARQNIAVIGLNPITDPANDTPAAWKNLGTGIACYNKAGCINNQPSTNGLIVNRVYNNTIYQEWHIRGTQARVLLRTGQAPNVTWYGSWNEVNMSESVLWSNASPTSSFAAQTLEIPTIGEYKMLRVEFKRVNNDNTCITMLVPTEAFRSYTALVNFNVSFSRWSGRPFNVNDSSIQFMSGNDSNASGNSYVNEAYCIPTKIVGIK